ncbi:MAG: T9SS type A sorting domain-containing protein [Nitrospirota bacterium]|nr:T9SS type A sorting domain-containing protein [Nitrospirota bacterium]
MQLEGGTPPYLEEWNTLDPLHLLAGTHPITIVDSLGCTLQLFAEILEPEVLAAEIFTTDAIPGGLPGSAEAFISGGTPPYHVSWSTMEDGVMEIHDLFPGIYSADIEDFNACSLHVEFEIVQQTGIFQVPVVSGIHLFPNPLETALHVSYQTSSEVAGAIRDVCGRCLVEFVLTPGNSLLVLPVDHLSSGLYVFCLQGFEGMNSTKLIKR